MPLTLDGNGPIAGTLARGQTLAARVAAIPGLHGAYEPSGLTAGAVADWAASVGNGHLIQPTAAAQPQRTSLLGQPVIDQGAGNMGLRADGSWSSGGALTIGIRLYLDQPDTDSQYILGGHTDWRVVWRSTAQWFLFDGVANITAAPSPAAGWHTLILSQSATTTTVDLDGVVTQAPNAGAPLFGGPAIGNSLTGATTISGFGWRGSYGRVLIAKSATYDTEHYRNVVGWLTGE